MSQDELLSHMIENNNQAFVTIGADVYRVYANKRGYHIERVVWIDLGKELPEAKQKRVPIATYLNFSA